MTVRQRRTLGSWSCLVPMLAMHLLQCSAPFDESGLVPADADVWAHGETQSLPQLAPQASRPTSGGLPIVFELFPKWHNIENIAWHWPSQQRLSRQRNALGAQATVRRIVRGRLAVRDIWLDSTVVFGENIVYSIHRAGDKVEVEVLPWSLQENRDPLAQQLFRQNRELKWVGPRLPMQSGKRFKLQSERYRFFFSPSYVSLGERAPAG